jgi:glycosyltransferase involved in cell wall biosynthesis
MFSIPAIETSDKEKLCDRVRVTVLVLAYNHAMFIEQAVTSILAQQCNFAFEILIGEDCSSDNTLALCLKLQSSYPQQIRLVSAHENVGVMSNFLRLVCRARGKYLALLDGDDYWTSRDKLKVQAALLDTDPEVAWCAGLTANRTFWAKKKPRYHLDDILRRYVFHTSAVMFRATLLERWPMFPNLVCLDNLLFAYIAQQGPCGYIDREMSYYRRHDIGVWTGATMTERFSLTMSCIDALEAFLGADYRVALVDREFWVYELEIDREARESPLACVRFSVEFLKLALPRMLQRDVRRTLGFIVRNAYQPVGGMYSMIRRKLALGALWRRMGG